jgi:benzoyl-CoA reductase/2-hydroxyglutaryl-CoA dehydratase subunit BcrC/BadD/HgdB
MIQRSYIRSIKYRFIKDMGFSALAWFSSIKKRVPAHDHPDLGPPLKSTAKLKEIMTRHYFLSRHVEGVKPVAWVTSGAPVELLRVFDFYTIYPENHGALCGAKKMGADLCNISEKQGFSRDLCSYARIDIGVLLSGKTPIGRLPRPDLLFASSNICQTVLYWYRVLAYHLNIPLLIFDTPFNFSKITESSISYMVRQIEEMIPQLEQISGKRFRYNRFKEVIKIARDTSHLWALVLAAMKASPSPMTIFDAFTHMAPVVCLRGLKVAHDYYKRLLKELKQRVEKRIGGLKNERKRLLWDNIPIWFLMKDMAQAFAKKGMNFVSATYTNAWAETITYLDENRPFESISKTYSLIILNTSLEHRLKLMQRLIKDYRIDGVVIHSARSCKPYSIGQYDIRRIIGNRLKIPCTIIEGDIADSRSCSPDGIMRELEVFFDRMEQD